MVGSNKILAAAHRGVLFLERACVRLVIFWGDCALVTPALYPAMVLKLQKCKRIGVTFTHRILNIGLEKFESALPDVNILGVEGK